MQTRLPDKIDPWKLAASAERLQGELALADMPRLVSLLSDSEGSVAVTLEAGTNDQVPFVGGCLETTVAMTCRRCLGTLALALKVVFQLSPVRAESQAASLPRDYEPLLVPEGEISLRELVEDELILALPLIPGHEDLHLCEANGFVLPQRAEKPNPFAALSALLQDSKQEQ